MNGQVTFYIDIETIEPADNNSKKGNRFQE